MMFKRIAITQRLPSRVHLKGIVDILSQDSRSIDSFLAEKTGIKQITLTHLLSLHGSLSEFFNPCQFLLLILRKANIQTPEEMTPEALSSVIDVIRQIGVFKSDDPTPRLLLFLTLEILRNCENLITLEDLYDDFNELLRSPEIRFSLMDKYGLAIQSNNLFIYIHDTAHTEESATYHTMMTYISGVPQLHLIYDYDVPTSAAAAIETGNILNIDTAFYIETTVVDDEQFDQRNRVIIGPIEKDEIRALHESESFRGVVNKLKGNHYYKEKYLEQVMDNFNKNKLSSFNEGFEHFPELCIKPLTISDVLEIAGYAWPSLRHLTLCLYSQLSQALNRRLSALYGSQGKKIPNRFQLLAQTHDQLLTLSTQPLMESLTPYTLNFEHPHKVAEGSLLDAIQRSISPPLVVRRILPSNLTTEEFFNGLSDAISKKEQLQVIIMPYSSPKVSQFLSLTQSGATKPAEMERFLGQLTENFPEINPEINNDAIQTMVQTEGAAQVLNYNPQNNLIWRAAPFDILEAPPEQYLTRIKHSLDKLLSLLERIPHYSEITSFIHRWKNQIAESTHDHRLYLKGLLLFLKEFVDNLLPKRIPTSIKTIVLALLMAIPILVHPENRYIMLMWYSSTWATFFTTSAFSKEGFDFSNWHKHLFDFQHVLPAIALTSISIPLLEWAFNNGTFFATQAGSTDPKTWGLVVTNAVNGLFILGHSLFRGIPLSRSLMNASRLLFGMAASGVLSMSTATGLTLILLNKIITDVFGAIVEASSRYREFTPLRLQDYQSLFNRLTHSMISNISFIPLLTKNTPLRGEDLFHILHVFKIIKDDTYSGKDLDRFFVLTQKGKIQLSDFYRTISIPWHTVFLLRETARILVNYDRESDARLNRIYKLLKKTGLFNEKLQYNTQNLETTFAEIDDLRPIYAKVNNRMVTIDQWIQSHQSELKKLEKRITNFLRFSDPQIGTAGTILKQMAFIWDHQPGGQKGLQQFFNQLAEPLHSRQVNELFDVLGILEREAYRRGDATKRKFSDALTATRKSLSRIQEKKEKKEKRKGLL